MNIRLSYSRLWGRPGHLGELSSISGLYHLMSGTSDKHRCLETVPNIPGGQSQPWPRGTALPFLGLLMNSNLQFNTIPRRSESQSSLRSMALNQGFSALTIQTLGPGHSLWGHPEHCSVMTSIPGPQLLNARRIFSPPVMTTTNVSIHHPIVSPGGQDHPH